MDRLVTAAGGIAPLQPTAAITAIGLTGGIGSGKSTVARTLVACGAHLVDTDAIARALTLPGGAAMPALAALFGPQAVDADGALDRDHMRRLVFSDASAKQRLEAVLHPLIGQQAQQQAERGWAAGKPVVFDVPLLAESAARAQAVAGGTSWRHRVQRVLVVDCREDTQIARVAQRPGWTAEAAARVLAQQASRRARRVIADAVIYNDGLELDALDAEVRSLWALWMVGSQPG